MLFGHRCLPHISTPLGWVSSYHETCPVQVWDSLLLSSIACPVQVWDSLLLSSISRQYIHLIVLLFFYLLYLRNLTRLLQLMD